MLGVEVSGGEVDAPVAADGDVPPEQFDGEIARAGDAVGANVELPRCRVVNYSWHVVEVVTSATFDRWLRRLKDRRAAARVLIRIERLAAGNPGDVKPVGQGISELRIDYGPGYRVYFLREGDRLILLLTGGAKPTQDADIRTAHAIAETWYRTQGAHE